MTRKTWYEIHPKDFDLKISGDKNMDCKCMDCGWNGHHSELGDGYSDGHYIGPTLCPNCGSDDIEHISVEEIVIYGEFSAATY